MDNLVKNDAKHIMAIIVSNDMNIGIIAKESVNVINDTIAAISILKSLYIYQENLKSNSFPVITLIKFCNSCTY